MILRFLLACLFLCSSHEAFAENLPPTKQTLAPRWHRADAGDYAVAQIHKNCVFLRVVEVKSNALLLEEISIPLAHSPKRDASWKTWREQGAKGNTAWLLYELDLTSGRLLSLYSHTLDSYLAPNTTHPFLPQLLTMTFSSVPEDKQLRVGPPPPVGKTDRRRPWRPPLVIDGKARPNPSFEVWKTQWPDDGSEISGRVLEVYLPAENYPCPTYLPYWVQVEDKVTEVSCRLIDSGKNFFPH